MTENNDPVLVQTILDDSEVDYNFMNFRSYEYNLRPKRKHNYKLVQVKRKKVNNCVTQKENVDNKYTDIVKNVDNECTDIVKNVDVTQPDINSGVSPLPQNDLHGLSCLDKKLLINITKSVFPDGRVIIKPKVNSIKDVENTLDSGNKIIIHENSKHNKKDELITNSKKLVAESLVNDGNESVNMFSSQLKAPILIKEPKAKNFTPALSQNQDDMISLDASSIPEENSEYAKSGTNDKSYVLNWIHNQHFNLISSKPVPYQHKSDKKKMYTLRNYSRGNLPNCHNKNLLLSVVNDVCKFHFYGNKCIFRKCKFPHRLTDQTKKYLRNLSYEKLKHIYNLSKEFNNLYFSILELFVKKVSSRNKSDELIALIDDILDQECLDRSQYIDLIVQELQAIGISLADAVFKILSYQFTNTDNIGCLNEILLNIIVKEKSVLEDNWYIVKTLTQDFQKMDFGVVTDIIEACLLKQPPSYRFCYNVCVDIFKKFHIPLLNNIPKYILFNFKCLLSEMNLTRYIQYLDAKEVLDNYNEEYVLDSNEKENNLVINPCNNKLLNNDTIRLNSLDDEIIDPVTKEYSKEVISVTKLSSENTQCNAIAENVNPINEVIAEEVNSMTIQCNKKAKKANDTNIESAEEVNSVTKQCDKKEEKGNSLNVECAKQINLVIIPSNEKINPVIEESAEEVSAVTIHCNEEANSVTALCSGEVNFVTKQCPEVINDNNKKINIISVESLPVTIPLSNLKKFVCTSSEEIIEENEHTSSHASCINNVDSTVSVFNVELLDADVIKLNTAIRKESIDAFTALLHKYKCSELRKSFVLHTLVSLKNQNKLDKDLVMLIIKSQKRLMNNDNDVKLLLESLALNLIESLGEKGKWIKACTIFQLFSDIEDVITSKCFVNKKTLLQRYLFSCLILIRGCELDNAFHLLKTSRLDLLDSKTWVDCEERDVCRQTYVLSEFFKAVIDNRLFNLAYDFVSYIIRKTCLPNIDIFECLHCTMEQMKTDFDTYHTELLGIANNIISDNWDITKIHEIDLRNLITITCKNGLGAVGLDLYRKCSSRNVYYHNYTGKERFIVIRTNMFVEEMFIIISDFFKKLVEGNFELSDIIIHVCLPLSLKEINSIQNLSLEIALVKKNIQTILTCLMKPIYVNIVNKNDTNTDIIIKATDIADCINHLRHPSPLQKDQCVE